MKVVFWSPVHGQTRQSSNMLSVALMLAMKKKCRIMITQTQLRMNDLEDAIVGRAVVKGIREQFYRTWESKQSAGALSINIWKKRI